MLVRVRNPEYSRQAVWFFTQPEYFEYTGDEVRLKWVGDHELALTTGNPEWPVRVIQRRLIISIDGKIVQPASSKTLSKVVRGSKGEEYVVTNDSGRMSCTCTGFQFRKTCKHIKELA